MKKYIFKAVAVGVLALGISSCTDELNIKSIDPQSNPTYDNDELFAKTYASLSLTGLKGPTGNGDLTDTEDKSGFYRSMFNLEELPTDEVNWAWQTDPSIPQITGISWNSTTEMNQWCYNRLGWNINLYNFFLRETAGATDEETKTRRAEVRFLRALNYYYYLDLYHMAPFKDENDPQSALPVEKSGKDLYDWLDKELTSLTEDLAPMGQNTFNKKSTNYGRADKGAAYMLHARLLLNAAVYTDGAVSTEAYKEAKKLCDQIIAGPYKLSNSPKTNPQNGLTYSGYAQLFMADNDSNADAVQEIIMPIRQDGLNMRSNSGTNMLVNSMRIAGMPYAGVSNCWSCIYARPNLVEQFFPKDNIPISTKAAPEDATPQQIIELDSQDGSDTKSILAAANDDRALFYAGRGGGLRKLRVDKLSNFLDGISIVKWQNIRTDGKKTHDQEFPDTDIPLFRLAEAYLTRAEVEWRLNGDNDAAALADLNVLRDRAHATPLTEVNKQTLIDEWSREFYTEGRRRSDLVRFNMFTGGDYVWAWKGGEAKGRSVPDYFKVYPVPENDIKNNKNLRQNDKY